MCPNRTVNVLLIKRCGMPFAKAVDQPLRASTDTTFKNFTIME